MPPLGPAKDQAMHAIARAVADEPAVVAAYLFGSVARGTAGPLSDVDAGLVMVSGEAADAVCDRVTERLARELRTPRIDVVPLRAAPLPLRYRVVRDGILVLCRDRAVLERFIVESVLHYLDFKVLRDRAFETQRAAILHRR